jgi:NDP-sugar pyrophosphorylase family protein
MGKPPPSSSSSNDTSDNKSEQKLQAVLLADSFSNAFHPIILEPYCDHPSSTSSSASFGRGDERPLVLCPLNNVPVLHHSIDFLQGNGIEELFVVCCASSGSADAVENYIRSNAASNAISGGGNNSGIGKAGVGRSTRNESNIVAEVDGGRKIAWSSRLSIIVMRFADCTNAGE